MSLQGGAAVQGLAPLAPWFGGRVVANSSAFCASGFGLSYEPLQARARRSCRRSRRCCLPLDCGCPAARCR